MFSVIIPVYNGVQWVAQAIESVLSQSFSDWELLVVDDGSTDDTPRVLERFRTDPKIQVLTQHNQGVSVARNTGIEYARGDYLAFLDADDVWHADHLAVMHELITRYPDAGLYGTFTRTELVSGQTIERCPYFQNRSDTVYLEDFFEAYAEDKSAKMFTMITTCFSAEALRKTGLFEPGCRIGEDLALSLKVAAYFPVVLCSKATATYRKENSSATKTVSFDPDWYFFEQAEALYADETIPMAKRENLRRVMQWFAMRRCRHYILRGEKRKAWQVFRGLDRKTQRLVDWWICLGLFCLPHRAVQKIFEIRWRNQA